MNLKAQWLILFWILIGGAVETQSSSKLPDFDKLWDFKKPSETENKFREVLKVAEKSNDLEYKAQLLTQIARTQGLQRNFDEAHKTLDVVETLLGKKTTLASVRYHLERGRVFNSSQNKTTALVSFQKSFELALQIKDDAFSIDAAHMIAIAEPSAEKQMEWNLKALEIAENSSNERAKNWLGSLYNNIGWTYHGSGKFAEALGLFRKAIAFRESKGEEGSIRIAKWCVARTYRSLNRISEALEIQLALEAEFAKLPEKDGFVFEELGELYLVKEMHKESQKYFLLAYFELSKDAGFVANESKRLSRIKELGGILK